MCWNCLYNSPILRQTFDAIRRLTAEPRYANGLKPLDLAETLGFETVTRLGSFLSVLEQEGVKQLSEADEVTLCDLSKAILEHANPGTLQRESQRILERRANGTKLTIDDAVQLHRDLVQTVTNTIERRVTALRLMLQHCPEKSGLRLTITERRYRIVPATETAPFDVGQLLPLYWWMSRPAWRNRIGCWEKLALKIVHGHFRLAVTTGILRHDDGSWAGEIPKLDGIPDPGVRIALQQALEASEMFSRILDLFYEPRNDDLVMRYRAREHGRRVALFLSKARNLVVEAVNGLLAGWVETMQPVEYLGMFPHQTDLVRVPKTTLEVLAGEFGSLFQLGLDLWFDEEREQRQFPSPERPPIASHGFESMPEQGSPTPRPKPEARRRSRRPGSSARRGDDSSQRC